MADDGKAGRDLTRNDAIREIGGLVEATTKAQETTRSAESYVVRWRGEVDQRKDEEAVERLNRRGHGKEWRSEGGTRDMNEWK